VVKAPSGVAGSGPVVVNGKSNGINFSFAPAITSISPQNVAAGQTITVVGLNFGSTTGTVTLSGESVKIVSWKTSAITFTVPTNVSIGADPVVVTNSVGSSPSAILNVQFAPSITSISPTKGQPSTQVTIAGTGFGTKTAGLVTFNGAPAQIVSWANTDIVVDAPNGLAGSGPVVVSWQGASSNGVTFSFLPTIVALIPSTVKVGYTFGIVGENFLASPGSATLNGTKLTTTFWSNFLILATVPSGAKTGPVVVTTSVGASNSETLTVQGGTAPLTITAMAAPPANAAGWNNTSVTVTFTCNGGVAPVTCPSAQTVSTQGANQTVTGTAKDSSGATATASVTLNIDLTPPVISATVSPVPNANGWINKTATVTFSCSDALSGVATCPAPVTVAQGANQVISGTATDKAGNSASASVTLNVSTTLPTITATLTPTPSASGWNTTPVTVSYTCTAGFAPIATCPAAQTISAAGANQQVTGTVTDVAGNSATLTTTVNIDLAGPTISATATPAPNASGWNDTSVTVSFTCTAGSAPIASCPASQIVSTAGANQHITGTVTDVAGDTATATVTLNIDLTPPVLTIATPATGATLTSSPASVSGSVSDALSGVASVTCDGAAATVQSGSYTCAVPLTAGADTISVQATSVAGESALQSVSVTYSSVPGITSFSPSSGAEGTVVTVTGLNFAPTGFSPEVTLNQQGGGTIVAPISSFSAGSLSFVIPAGAVTGPITVTVDGQSVTSSNLLAVTSSSSFTLTAGPSSVTLLPGQSADVQVLLASSTGFTQPASLSVSGVPSGVTASFQPPQITAGSSSFLTLSAPSGQSTSSSALTISATATVQGISQTQTAQVSLNVQAPSGSATFAGQVAVTGIYNTPLVGVTVSFTGTNYTGGKTDCTGSATTDAGGNFVLNGLSSSCTGSQMIQYDPSTVTAPPGKYSGVTLSYVLTPGQVTTPGLIVHLPNVTNAETFLVSQSSSSNQTFVSQSIPGVTFTIYAGTTLSLADGAQPNPFPLSIIEIPYNQVPDFMPPDPTQSPVFAMSIEPDDSSSSLPIAITYPNRSNTPPGTDLPLTSLNPTMGMMVNYGTGSVSPNGTQIIPDSDPAHPGHLYGVSNFDWFFFLPPPPNNTNPSPDPNCPCAGEPVDSSSGILTETNTDIAFGTARAQVAVTRVFRSMNSSLGTFGRGSSNNYNYTLNLSYLAGQITLIMPDGNQFPFAEQANGTYTNSTVPSMAGAVISIGSGGSYTLRWKDGRVFQFQPLSVNYSNGNFGYLTSITDANGNTITILRNGLAEITQITDPNGRSLNLAYGLDAEGHIGLITSITDPLGRSVFYTYDVGDGSGMLASVTDEKGGVTTYTHNSQFQLTAITDPLGNTYQNAYDPNGRVIQQTAPNGGVTQFAYTLLNSQIPTSPVSTTVVTDPRLNTTTYQFNPAGFLISQTDALGNQTVYNVNSSTNQTMSMTDPLGRTTAYTYDSNGNRTSFTLLEAVSSGESVGGGSADVVGPTTTSYVFDPVYSKLTSMTDPLGNVTTYSYNNNGNLLNVKDPLGRQTSYTYDSYGEKVTATDPLGNVTQSTYSNGTLSSQTDALGRVSGYVSDIIGRQIAATSPLGQTTQNTYDPLGKVVNTTDAAGNRTSESYDLNENLLSVADPSGNTTTFSYDSMNRLLTRTDSLGHKESYQYDLNENLTQFTDRRGVSTNYTYDLLNRKVLVTYGSGGGSVFYTYDAMSRMTQAADSITGAVSRSYDLLDRMILENTSNGSVSYAYDAAGRRITKQVSGQATVTYAYDADYELTQMTQGSSAAVLAYDADGRRTSLTLPNGVVTSYGYDPVSELTAIGNQMGNTSVGNLNYLYDADGHRTSVGGTLAQTGLPAAASAGSYNANNQLMQWKGNNFTYDANGNLLSDGTNTYTWDGRNHLVGISGGVSASFKYDPFGRRASKTVGATTTSFVYDGVNSVQELQSGVASANMLDGLGTDEYYQRTDTSGTGDFLSDALGDTVSLVGGSGATIAQYTYDPFGNTTATGTSSNTYQYTGRENDGTGLYYYRARYYSPQTGRFISEDPVGFAGGTDLYAYAANSPSNFNDPLGLCPPQKKPCAPSGSAPTPGQYRALGWAAQASWFLDPLAGGAFNLGLLANFRRGALLDAQVLYGGSQAYANYAYGDYMAAAGFSLEETLAGANLYGSNFSNYPAGTPMDPNYPGIPAANVANITNGWNDEQNGTLCSTN
jgi:RHS repeat-associated protein